MAGMIADEGVDDGDEEDFDTAVVGSLPLFFRFFAFFLGFSAVSIVFSIPASVFIVVFFFFFFFIFFFFFQP